MTAIADDNIFGFYASFQSGETDQELVKKYLWGDNGLKEQLKSLKINSQKVIINLYLYNSKILSNQNVINYH